MNLRPAELTDGWQRLDPRMLLVHPVKELIRFLPALAGLFVAGAASGGMDLRWQLIGIGVPVAVGLMRYLTTSYRITGDRVELRRGLVSRHLLSTRLDRIRTVDLTASPVHRLLGLTTVRIGTGTASTSDDDQVDLDGLPVDGARSLRQDLLHRIRPTESVDGGPGAVEVPDDERVVLVLDPAWARYAPLTATGVVLTAGALGVGSQVYDQLTGPGTEVELDLSLDGSSALVLVPLVLLGLAVVITVLAVAGYLVTNWGFTLSHTRRDGSWHLRRGLLTTRETSLDEARLSGVAVGEPLGLRLAGAARLSAIVTGLDRQQQGSSVLVPPAPHAVVTGVGATVLGTDGPLAVPLEGHGPAAVRRRYVRGLVPALLGTAVLGVAVLAGAPTWLLAPALLLPVAGAALAADRARSLGHALVDGFLVARSGSLYRQRQALAVTDVIGWTYRATWFQRRAGLTTLVATTAGGPQSVTVLDIPEVRAVELTGTAMPHLVRQFTAETATGR